MLRRFWARLSATIRPRQEEEFDEELREHLSLLQERFIRQGMASDEAFYAARRQFGGLTRLGQQIREQRRLPVIEELGRDVRNAVRQLVRSKAFTASAALILALGIGATTAVFAVMHAVVLRPLPYADPDRVMAFRSVDRRNGPEATQISYPNFLDFRTRNRVFDHFVSYRESSFTLNDPQPAAQVTGVIVSWDLFQLLGVQPALGRGFLPDEERPGTHAVVLSHALWADRFGAKPGIVGRTVPIGGVPYTVVGVAPEGFEFPLDLPGAQLWTTLADEAIGPDQRGSRMLDAIGRLRPGVSIEQAQGQMDAVAAALAREYPDANRHVPTTLVQPELTRLRSNGGFVLVILFGGVLLVLLIACANVASLLLARSADRAREFALRMALGASRWAIVRQLLVESLTLGLVGASGGAIAAVGLLKVMLPLAGDRIPRLADTTVDWRVLAFSIALAILTSVLFGLAPALQATRTDPAGELKEGARTIAAGRDRFQSALVTGQIALGVVLLVGAGLLLAAFVAQIRSDPGFAIDRLLTFEVGVSAPQYSEDAQIAFCDRLREELRAIPGVESAAAGTPLPLQGHEMRVGFEIDGSAIPRAERPRSDIAIVTPAYFKTMGIPLLRGRDFSEADRRGAPLVMIVNQAFARKFFPGQDAVGKRMLPGVGKPPVPVREIVGVVGDARQAPLGSVADPIYYLPYKQLPWFIGTIVVRSALSAAQLESAARSALARVDRGVPMRRVRTGAALAADVVAPARFVTVLMSGFAVVALLLTVAGLYGVLSYMVAKRRREIGVRIALGAPRAETIGLVWRRAARLVAAGLFVGTGAAIGLARVAASVVGGGSVGLPSVLAATWCAMAVTSALAALVPAARAASVDPMQALRTE